MKQPLSLSSRHSWHVVDVQRMRNRGRAGRQSWLFYHVLDWHSLLGQCALNWRAVSVPMLTKGIPVFYSLESTLLSLIIELVIQSALDRRVHSGLYLLSNRHDWLCLLFSILVARGSALVMTLTSSIVHGQTIAP